MMFRRGLPLHRQHASHWGGRRLFWACLAFAVATGLPPMPAQAQRFGSVQPVKHQVPEFPTFEELITLSRDPHPSGALREKYHALWNTPVINNEAYYRGVRPIRPVSDKLGPFVRVVSWNIEKSLQVDAAIQAFTNEEAFVRRLNPKRAKPDSRRYQRALEERASLEQADVIILQEMDIGMKRSDYRDAARDLAEALEMNYTYVPAYVEVDPVLLGTEEIFYYGGRQDDEATKHYQADPTLCKALFGSAVLSRYPIVSVEAFPLHTQPYDWYWREKQKTSFLEKLRRLGAKSLLREAQTREMKVGGRTYFRVDLHVPDLPEQRVSVINVHLEIKSRPRDRAAQLAEILQYIKEISHPVILAGDFNSAPSDLSPTSTPRVIERTIAAPEFWVSRATEALLPQALLYSVLRFTSNITKNYQNPTARHIPWIAPNQTGEMFRMIERFRFEDGGAFDFRGSRRRAAGRGGMLGNSNERDGWAYRTTFRIDRTVGQVIGKYRLDWIFVKAYLGQPKDRRGPYRFAPHFGRTLNALNVYLTERISDHDPNLVDLPLQEPSDPKTWPR